MKTILGSAVAGLPAKMVRVAGVVALVVAGILASGCVGYYGHPYAGGYYSASYAQPYGYGYPYYGYPSYGAPYGYGGAAVVINSGGYRGYGNHRYGRHYYPATTRVQGNHQGTRSGGTSSRPHANTGTRTRTGNPRTQATQPE